MVFYLVVGGITNMLEESQMKRGEFSSAGLVPLALATLLNRCHFFLTGRRHIVRQFQVPLLGGPRVEEGPPGGEAEGERKEDLHAVGQHRHCGQRGQRGGGPAQEEEHRAPAAALAVPEDGPPPRDVLGQAQQSLDGGAQEGQAQAAHGELEGAVEGPPFGEQEDTRSAGISGGGQVESLGGLSAVTEVAPAPGPGGQALVFIAAVCHSHC